MGIFGSSFGFHRREPVGIGTTKAGAFAERRDRGDEGLETQPNEGFLTSSCGQETAI